jgi:hypothetical protein
MWFGRYLAAANLLYFSANLFVFLIPRFLPRAFEKYFCMRDEVCAKTAEDKHAGGGQLSSSSPAPAAEQQDGVVGAAKPDVSKKAD